jgi:IS4 transposase
MAQAVREVRVSTESGTVLRLFTNDLDAPATEIAALYRRRWAIEMFFRWVTQMLRIGHFYGESESAVAIQVTVALIAFVLLKLAHAAQGAVEGLTQFARLVSAMLMQQRPIEALRGRHARPPAPPIQLCAQAVLPWA